MKTKEEIIFDIRDFCDKNHMAITTFGRRVANDPSLLNKLLKGGGLTKIKEQKIYDFIKDNQSKGILNDLLG